MDAVDDFVVGRRRERTGVVPLDVSQHLAKVRVAGSNPVVRSRPEKKARSRRVFGHRQNWRVARYTHSSDMRRADKP